MNSETFDISMSAVANRPPIAIAQPADGCHFAGKGDGGSWAGWAPSGPT
jgi:hypothetical protein